MTVALVYDLAIVGTAVVAEAVNDVSKLLGPLGAEAMEVLWAAGEPLTVRAVLGRLNRGRVEPFAYTTVMTGADPAG